MFSFPTVFSQQQPSAQQPNPYEQLRNILLASQLTGNNAGLYSQVPQGLVAANPVLDFSHLWQIWSALHQQVQLPPQVHTPYVPSVSPTNTMSFHVNARGGDERRDRKKHENQSRKRKRSPEPVRRPYSPPIVTANQCLEEPEFDTIVVDTNAMILSLEQIAGLKEFEYFTIIVPFTVVNELDNMKMQNKDPELRAKAKRAISYLFEHTSSNDSKWIQLQTRNQVLNIAHGGTAHGYKTNNDDRILDCAMYFQHATKRVVLLTEDKNLTLKARCNAIEAAPVRTLLAKLPSIRLWNEQKDQILSKRRKLSDDPEPESSKTLPVAATAQETNFPQKINSLSPLSSTQPL